MSVPRTSTSLPATLKPPPNCALCPRLADYRAANRAAHPAWHNAPALPLGDLTSRVLIVGLAPGRTGANRTGRVFTGDAAGRLLFDTLIRTGLASGTYSDDGCDDLRLNDCVISNAVLCAPPANAPTRLEQATCRRYLAALIAAMPNLATIVSLGEVSRSNVLKALGFPIASMPAGHGTEARLGRFRILHSHHCSRLNVNTGRLTPDMLHAVFVRAAAFQP